MEDPDRVGKRPTYFEAIVAMSFVHFLQSGARHAVVETGIGGPADATNVFEGDRVDATVLCPIEKEHSEILGDDVESIARTEAAVIKPHRPVIIAPQSCPELTALLEAVCREKQCQLHTGLDRISVEHDGYLEKETTILEQLEIRIDKSLVKRSGDLLFHRVQTPFVGKHQHQNIQTAVLAALVAKSEGWKLTEQAIRRGIEDVELRGRFQTFRSAPSSEWYVLDGAHTKHSARALCQCLRDVFPHEAVVLILCMAKDKEHRDTITELLNIKPDVVIFTSTQILDRAAPPGTLLAHWEKCEMEFRKRTVFRCRKTLTANLPTALVKARTELRGLAMPGAKSPGVICVTGSLPGVGQALEAVQNEQTLHD